jgi:hypothetical protein
MMVHASNLPQLDRIGPLQCSAWIACSRSGRTCTYQHHSTRSLENCPCIMHIQLALVSIWYQAAIQNRAWPSL